MLRERFGLVGFCFFDDSFAVGKPPRPRAVRRDRARSAAVWWTCTAHPAHLDRDVLADMKRAGCAGIDIGMESADPGMLVRIGKGVTVERVLDVLGWARELGIHTRRQPDVRLARRDRRRARRDDRLHAIARRRPRGRLQRARRRRAVSRHRRSTTQHHERFGFTGWWLREPPLDYLAVPDGWDEAEIMRAYADDPALDRNFFHHPPHRGSHGSARRSRMKAEVTLAISRRRADVQARRAPPPARADAV